MRCDFLHGGGVRDDGCHGLSRDEFRAEYLEFLFSSERAGFGVPP